MQIPQSFRDAQAAAFQDKEITLLETVTARGALGGVTNTPGVDVSAHACNVQVVSDKLTAEQFGLELGRDIIVTAAQLPIEKDAFIRWNGEIYRVEEAPHYDAYVKLLAKRVAV